MPYSRTAEATAPRTRYFSPASEARCPPEKAANATSGSVESSSATYRVMSSRPPASSSMPTAESSSSPTNSGPRTANRCV